MMSHEQRSAEQEAPLQHLEDLASSAIQFLRDQSSTIINISCAEALLKLMETVAGFGDSR